MAQYATYGLQLSQGIAGFMIGSIQAKLALTLQKYQNEMLAVQESMNANKITANEIATQDASVRLNWAIQMQSASDLGAAEVAAAAAGVRGASVDSTMRGLRRSAANAQGARKSQTQNEMRSHRSDRRDNALATVLATNIEVHQGPSILSAAIGVGLNLLNTYEDSKTATQKAGKSIVQTRPSTALGLAGAASDTLLEGEADFWKSNTALIG